MPTPNLATLIDPKNLPPLISPSQGSALGIASEREMRRMCQEGRIKAYRVGRHWRIHRDSLLKQFDL